MATEMQISTGKSFLCSVLQLLRRDGGNKWPTRRCVVKLEIHLLYYIQKHISQVLSTPFIGTDGHDHDDGSADLLSNAWMTTLSNRHKGNGSLEGCCSLWRSCNRSNCCTHFRSWRNQMQHFDCKLSAATRHGRPEHNHPQLHCTCIYQRLFHLFHYLHHSPVWTITILLPCCSPGAALAAGSVEQEMEKSKNTFVTKCHQ